jgi:hypothetical protein
MTQLHTMTNNVTDHLLILITMWTIHKDFCNLNYCVINMNKKKLYVKDDNLYVFSSKSAQGIKNQCYFNKRHYRRRNIILEQR